MKIILSLIVLLSISINGDAQITFEVEKLTPPNSFLEEQNTDQIISKWVLKNLQIQTPDEQFDPQIIAKGNHPERIIWFQQNPFFYSMYEAYANHRPYVLSPDMIWLLVLQGFNQHVQANAEALREKMVDFDGVMSLVIESQHDLYGDEMDWPTLFNDIQNQIMTNAKSEAKELFDVEFTTSTIDTKLANQITLMDAYENYFEYIVYYAGCGIPSITLEGTVEDWKKLRLQVANLGAFELQWWIDELMPLLDEFVEASKGKVNKRHWRKMFKWHSKKEYGAPKIIDGWIVKFFPYDKDAQRLDLKSIGPGIHLPSEMVQVDVQYLYKESPTSTEIIEKPLEVWAGFIGAEMQGNFGLRPVISWFVREKSEDEQIKLNDLERINNEFLAYGKPISLRVKEIPEMLQDMKVIHSLHLEFIDDVEFPNWFDSLDVRFLDVYGRVNKKHLNNLKKWFPNSSIKVNGNRLQEGIYTFKSVYEDDPSNLHFNAYGRYYLDLSCGFNLEETKNYIDQLPHDSIENIRLCFRLSEEEFQSIQQSYPKLTFSKLR